MATKPLAISRDLCSDAEWSLSRMRRPCAAQGEPPKVGGRKMGSLSIFHWLIVFLVFGSPIMGVIRGVKNSSIPHAVLSVFIPAYGFFYFFAGKRDTSPDIKAGT
jgi:hypothetical protein